MKAEKEQKLVRHIDLDKLREQGFSIDIEHKEDSPYEFSRVVIVAKHTRKGTVLKDEVAAELEMTYGVKKTDALQKRAVRMLNELAFQDALRIATK